MARSGVRSYCGARPQLGSVRAVARIPSTPRNFRVTDDLWTAAMTTAADAGENLPDKLREFLAWYARRPGARQPTRPAPRAADRPDSS